VLAEQIYSDETVILRYNNNNNNNNKLYLHDYNKVLQYCKSRLNLIINYFINNTFDEKSCIFFSF